jgi:RNA polymerase sigma-70 factor, ECF subfamily
MQPEHHDPDKPLLEAIAAGDTGALEELYRQHGLHILNYLLGQLGNRQLAEDVLQTVMLAVWNQAAGFRGESRVRTWLFAIARRQASKAQRHPPDDPLPLDETGAQAQTDGDPRSALERALQREELESALAQLPAIQQEALELVFYRGLTINEAATHLGIPANTVKSRLHRARANLRKLLEPEETGNA